MNKIVIAIISIMLVLAGTAVGTNFILRSNSYKQTPTNKTPDTKKAAVDTPIEVVVEPSAALIANDQNKEKDITLASQFIINTVDLGSATSDEKGIVRGTVSNLASMSPGMHTIEVQGEGKDGNLLVKRIFFNIAGKPRAGSVYGVYFNIFNPKRIGSRPEVIDIEYQGKNYATLSPDENGGIFVQFPIAKNQEKFEATATSRGTGKIMKVSVDVNEEINENAEIVPKIENADPRATADQYFVIVNDEEPGNMPVGVFAGEQLHIKMGPYEPNSTVKSDSEEFGVFNVGANGIIDEIITMPDLGPGVHELVFFGDCPSGAAIGLLLRVFYPGNPVADGSNSYGVYLTGFNPSEGDYDKQEEVNINYIGMDFGSFYPDEDGGVFIVVPIFTAAQGKIEFTATSQLTGKSVEVSLDLAD